MDADRFKIFSQDNPDWSGTEGPRSWSCSATWLMIRRLLHLGPQSGAILSAQGNLVPLLLEIQHKGHDVVVVIRVSGVK